MKLLDGKAAIITGASSGIGRAAAGLFAEHGASLVLVARRADRLEEVAALIERQGGQARVVVGDVTQEKTHRDAVATALAPFLPGTAIARGVRPDVPASAGGTRPPRHGASCRGGSPARIQKDLLSGY